MAFYGSAKTEKLPIQFWGVGLAGSEKIAGAMEKMILTKILWILRKTLLKNPIVTNIGDSIFIAVMDAHGDGFGIHFLMTDSIVGNVSY